MRRAILFSSEPIDVLFLYMAVGLAFLPWGALYAVLSFWGWNHWSLAVLLLGGGFLTGHRVWAALDIPKASTPTEIINQSKPALAGWQRIAKRVMDIFGDAC